MKELIINMTKEAGNTAIKHIGRNKVMVKSVKNFYTDTDILIEKKIIGDIKNKYPDHNIISEETRNDLKNSAYTWYVDPIDGTHNYIHGDPNFCISIAVSKNDELIYGCIYLPMLNEMYFAEKSKGTELNGKKIHVSNISRIEHALIQSELRPFEAEIDETWQMFRHFMLKADRVRDYGFCAGQMAYVAAGRADALVKTRQNSWDIAAGIIIIQEAGGRITNLNDGPVNLKDPSVIVASNGLLHKEILENIRR